MLWWFGLAALFVIAPQAGGIKESSSRPAKRDAVGSLRLVELLKASTQAKGSGLEPARRRSKRSVFLHSGVRICPQETLTEVLASHQAYYQLRVCQEAVWEAFRIFFDRIPGTSEYQRWVHTCQHESLCISDLAKNFSSSEEHMSMIERRLSRLRDRRPPPSREVVTSAPTQKLPEIAVTVAAGPEAQTVASSVAVEADTSSVPLLSNTQSATPGLDLHQTAQTPPPPEEELQEDSELPNLVPESPLEHVIEFSINLVDAGYKELLDDPDSPQYIDLSQHLQDQMLHVFDELPGFKAIRVLRISEMQDTEGPGGISVHYSLVFEINSPQINSEDSEKPTGMPESSTDSQLREIVTKALREEASLPIDMNSLNFEPETVHLPALTSTSSVEIVDESSEPDSHNEFEVVTLEPEVDKPRLEVPLTPLEKENALVTLLDPTAVPDDDVDQSDDGVTATVMTEEMAEDSDRPAASEDVAEESEPVYVSEPEPSDEESEEEKLLIITHEIQTIHHEETGELVRDYMPIQPKTDAPFVNLSPNLISEEDQTATDEDSEKSSFDVQITPTAQILFTAAPSEEESSTVGLAVTTLSAITGQPATEPIANLQQDEEANVIPDEEVVEAEPYSPAEDLSTEDVTELESGVKLLEPEEALVIKPDDTFLEVLQPTLEEIEFPETEEGDVEVPEPEIDEVEILVKDEDEAEVLGGGEDEAEVLGGGEDEAEVLGGGEDEATVSEPEGVAKFEPGEEAIEVSEAEKDSANDSHVDEEQAEVPESEVEVVKTSEPEEEIAGVSESEVEVADVSQTDKPVTEASEPAVEDVDISEPDEALADDSQAAEEAPADLEDELEIENYEEVVVLDEEEIAFNLPGIDEKEVVINGLEPDVGNADSTEDIKEIVVAPTPEPEKDVDVVAPEPEKESELNGGDGDVEVLAPEEEGLETAGSEVLVPETEISEAEEVDVAKTDAEEEIVEIPLSKEAEEDVEASEANGDVTDLVEPEPEEEDHVIEVPETGAEEDEEVVEVVDVAPEPELEQELEVDDGTEISLPDVVAIEESAEGTGDLPEPTQPPQAEEEVVVESPGPEEPTEVDEETIDVPPPEETHPEVSEPEMKEEIAVEVTIPEEDALEGPELHPQPELEEEVVTEIPKQAEEEVDTPEVHPEEGIVDISTPEPKVDVTEPPVESIKVLQPLDSTGDLHFGEDAVDEYLHPDQHLLSEEDNLPIIPVGNPPSEESELEYPAIDHFYPEEDVDSMDVQTESDAGSDTARETIEGDAHVEAAEDITEVTAPDEGDTSEGAVVTEELPEETQEGDSSSERDISVTAEAPVSDALPTPPAATGDTSDLSPPGPTIDSGLFEVAEEPVITSATEPVDILEESEPAVVVIDENLEEDVPKAGESTTKRTPPATVPEEVVDMAVQDLTVELDQTDVSTTEPNELSEEGSGLLSPWEEHGAVSVTAPPPLRYLTTPSMTTASQGRELVVFFSLRVTNMDFSEGLFNKTSSEYRSLENTFLDLLMPYLQANLTGFRKLEILNFRKGSVVVNSKMKFAKSVPYNVTEAVHCVLEEFCSEAAKNLHIQIDTHSLDIEPADQADPCKFLACEGFSRCVVNRRTREAQCRCQPGFLSVDGLPCESLCVLQPNYCQGGECHVVPGHGAVCRHKGGYSFPGLVS